MSRLNRCYNIADLRAAAKKRLPNGVFEYFDRGSEDETALAENRKAFERIRLHTRFMRDLSQRDMSTTLFGKKIGFPLVIGPTGWGGFCWYRGEAALARAAAAANIPFTLASTSIIGMDAVAHEAGPRRWFQIYMWEETDLSHAMIDRAAALGYEALVVTIDSALGRNREHNARNDFNTPFRFTLRNTVDFLGHPRWLGGTMLRYLTTTGLPKHENHPPQYWHLFYNAPQPNTHQAMTWRDIRTIRDRWRGTLIVKAVLSAEDARQAVDAGADGIVVSNHGGRALDSAVATMDVLPSIAAAVGGKTTIILDSGVRRGSDIVKALALGAHCAMVGRATLYGAAVAGEAGAAHAIAILKNEFEKTMGYLGCRTVAEITPDLVARRSEA